jgi:hypothetical protein
MVAGYRETRDVIQLYEKGTGGFEELRHFILDREEVLYAFCRVDDKYAMITYISDKATGVKRARALVHGRNVAALFKENNLTVTISTPAELTERNVRSKLRNEYEPASAKAAMGSKKDLTSGGSRRDLTKEAGHSTSNLAATSHPNLAAKSPELTYAAPPVAISTEVINEGRVKSSVNLAEPAGSVAKLAGSHSNSQQPSHQNLAQPASTNNLEQTVASNRASTNNVAPVTNLATSKANLMGSNNSVKVSNSNLTSLEVHEHKREQYTPVVKQQPRRTNLSSEIQGWVTEMTSDRLWRRRLFAIDGHDLVLYTCVDATPKEARRVNLRDLSAVKPCHEETIVTNSVKLSFSGSDEMYFFCDSTDARNEFMSLTMAR